MNIQDAVKKAAKTGTTIRRKSYPRGIICVLPTNTPHGCLLVSPMGCRVAQYRWQPTLDDLAAGDWEVDEKEKDLLCGRTGTDDGGGTEGNGADENGAGDGDEVTGDETTNILEPD